MSADRPGQENGVDASYEPHGPDEDDEAFEAVVSGMADPLTDPLPPRAPVARTTGTAEVRPRAADSASGPAAAPGVQRPTAGGPAEPGARRDRAEPVAPSAGPARPTVPRPAQERPGPRPAAAAEPIPPGGRPVPEARPSAAGRPSPGLSATAASGFGGVTATSVPVPSRWSPPDTSTPAPAQETGRKPEPATPGVPADRGGTAGGGSAPTGGTTRKGGPDGSGPPVDEETLMVALVRPGDIPPRTRPGPEPASDGRTPPAAGPPRSAPPTAANRPGSPGPAPTRATTGPTGADDTHTAPTQAIPVVRPTPERPTPDRPAPTPTASTPTPPGPTPAHPTAPHPPVPQPTAPHHTAPDPTVAVGTVTHGQVRTPVPPVVDQETVGLRVAELRDAVGATGTPRAAGPATSESSGGRAERRKAAKAGTRGRKRPQAAPPATTAPSGRPLTRIEARQAARALKDSPAVIVSRLAGELFITFGALMLLFVTYQLWWTNVRADSFAHHETSKIQNTWKARKSAKPQNATFQPGEGFAIIHIPKLDVVVPIAQGVSKPAVLDHGMVGHYSEGSLKTAMPSDKSGNFALAGHRNSHGEPFRYINHLQPGDKVVVETQDEYYTYEMTKTLPQTSSANVGVIQPVPEGSGFTKPGRYITLTTCTPEFTSTYRLIVWGKMVSEQPRDQGLPAALTRS